MINYALSPLIDNLTMMTSSKWKINVIFLVENCLSYNISKFGLNWTNGLSDTKQNEIWPLTFICITKMASYELDVFMWFDCLVTLHMHTKFDLGNLWWMVMKIWMIMWKHKMAPRWRQDGLISTACYYVIWLADHITYAYKIWAWLDQ